MRVRVPSCWGRPAIYRGEPPRVAFTNSLIRFVPGPGVMPEWALLVFRRHMHARRFMRESRITTNIAHLALGRFRTVEFPIPPLDIQRELVASIRAALVSIDQVTVQIHRTRAKIKAVRRTLLAAGLLGPTRPPRSRRRASVGPAGPDRRISVRKGQATEGQGMITDPKTLVQRLWDFCDVLRDDGLSYGDYLEQLTYLLFLKMADEQHELLGGERVVRIEYDWQSLLSRSGAELEAHYAEILSELGAGEDMLGVVFHKARNRIQTPAKLEQLVKDFIDKHEWLSYDADLKGAAYEGLIEKTAQEGARGAGQYFTPRSLISAIVDVMQPEPGNRICDPACGTGGFFLGAYRSIIDRFTPLEPDQVAHLRSGAFTGWEIADLPARLCAMNLLLHGIESPRVRLAGLRRRRPARRPRSAFRHGAD